MKRDTEGLSEVTSELFILLAVIALAIIVAAMIFVTLIVTRSLDGATSMITKSVTTA